MDLLTQCNAGWASDGWTGMPGQNKTVLGTPGTRRTGCDEDSWSRCNMDLPMQLVVMRT